MNIILADAEFNQLVSTWPGAFAVAAIAFAIAAAVWAIFWAISR